MVLAKKVFISSDSANVLLSCPNTCLSNICSMNMCSFFDCSKNAISYKVKKEQTSYDENEFTRLFDKYLRPKPAFYAVLNTALQL